MVVDGRVVGWFCLILVTRAAQVAIALPLASYLRQYWIRYPNN